MHRQSNAISHNKTCHVREMSRQCWRCARHRGAVLSRPPVPAPVLCPAQRSSAAPPCGRMAPGGRGQLVAKPSGHSRPAAVSACRRCRLRPLAPAAPLSHPPELVNDLCEVRPLFRRLRPAALQQRLPSWQPREGAAGQGGGGGRHGQQRAVSADQMAHDLGSSRGRGSKDPGPKVCNHRRPGHPQQGPSGGGGGSGGLTHRPGRLLGKGEVPSHHLPHYLF